MTALLVGDKPPLLYEYVTAPPYDTVVVGSMALGELLCFQNATVLEALAEGKPVVFYTPGLPKVTGNRALSASLSARFRELKSWGAVFTDGESRRVITAELARAMVGQGQQPPEGAVLTPLAREILGRN